MTGPDFARHDQRVVDQAATPRLVVNLATIKISQYFVSFLHRPELAGGVGLGVTVGVKLRRLFQ